jgi:hypothetical protein
MILRRIFLVPCVVGLGLAGLTRVPLPAQTIAAPRAPGAAFEWRTEFTATARSDIAEGSRGLGEILHHHTLVEGVRTLPLGAESSLLIGATLKRFDFSGSRADVPESLTGLALKLGYARTLSPRWSLRAEIDPGVYSDFEEVSGDDFNAPFGLRALYAASRELQWGFALFVDPRSRLPVIGGVGARWQFAPDWTLLAFLPAPRVEYAVSPGFSVFAGGLIRGGTFRVAEDFGRRRGRSALDNQNVDFREITVGVGGRWQIQSGLSLNAGVGWMLDRRFEYEDRDLLINGDGAPSFTLSLSGTL